MTKIEIVQKLLDAKVTAIVRGVKPEQMPSVAAALEKGGIQSIEITFNTPGAAEMIISLKEAYGDRFLVGAGTVLDTETCRTAILAGADFVLSPTLNTDVIRMCNRYGKAAVPGVMTPTEILTAIEYGADIVKVFPAGTLTPAYIKDVLGPIKQVNIMAVGGVSLDNASDFFKAGCKCLGIGSSLVNNKLCDEGKFDEIERRAAAFAEKAK